MSEKPHLLRYMQPEWKDDEQDKRFLEATGPEEPCRICGRPMHQSEDNPDRLACSIHGECKP